MLKRTLATSSEFMDATFCFPRTLSTLLSSPSTLPPLHFTGQSLGAEFQKCAKRAQTRNLSRKKTSMLNLRLNDYRQVYFDKEDRKRIPEAVIEEIR